MEVVVENKNKTMESSRFDFSPSNNNDDSSLRLGAHVLAVDDSLVDRKVIEKLLKITSCKVTAVDSGRRALQFLGLDGEEKQKQKRKEEEEKAGKEKEERKAAEAEAEAEAEEERRRRCAGEEEDGMKIDLIITDYCMPGMTGYELLKKIKESSSLREIPVVIMSSENIVARIHRCLEEGAEDFIVKPVKLSDVKRLVECLMSSIRDVGANNKTTSTPTAKGPPLPNPTLGADTNKRKQPDGSDLSPSSSSASELYDSSSETSSEMSPSPSPLVSPADSTLTSPSQSPPPSPSRVVGELIPDSPTRKVRQTTTTTTTLASDEIQASAAASVALASSPADNDDVADVLASPF